MEPRPLAICFDLDGTLCTYARPSSAVLAAAFDHLGVEPCFSMADFHARYVDFLADSADGDELYERCFTALAEVNGADTSLGREITRAFLDERDPDELQPVDGAREVVQELGEEYRLGLITNGHPALQREKLRAIGLVDAFETVVFAGYDTAPKPDPAPFDRALADLDVPAERALYVGNSLSADVAGARAAGLTAAWLATDGVDPDPEPEVVLESLSDLLDVVG